MEKKKGFELHSDLLLKLEEYRKLRNFVPESWVSNKIKKFSEYLSNSRLSGAIVSLSGGIDSSVIAVLAKKTMEIDKSPLKRFVAIKQPINSSGWSVSRADELCEKFSIENVTINQTEFQDKLKALVDSTFNIKGNLFSEGQLRSYMRTPVNYYSCQLLNQSGNPAIVLGTGNMDEDGYLGYFCKAGDGAVDVQLIADLHKSEVNKVARFLGIPDSIVKAKPSADLWEDQSDEDELGFSYDFVELLTGYYDKLSSMDQESFLKSLSDDARTQFIELKSAAEFVHRRNSHKLAPPVNLRII